MKKMIIVVSILSVSFVFSENQKYPNGIYSKNYKKIKMKEVAYIKLVDLEPSPCNQIVVEDSVADKTMLLECPHHIIGNVIKIVGDQIKQKTMHGLKEALPMTL